MTERHPAFYTTRMLTTMPRCAGYVWLILLPQVIRCSVITCEYTTSWLYPANNAPPKLSHDIPLQFSACRNVDMIRKSRSLRINRQSAGVAELRKGQLHTIFIFRLLRAGAIVQSAVLTLAPRVRAIPDSVPMSPDRVISTPKYW